MYASKPSRGVSRAAGHYWRIELTSLYFLRDRLAFRDSAEESTSRPNQIDALTEEKEMNSLRSNFSRYGAAALALSVPLAVATMTAPSTGHAQGAGADVYNAMPPGVDAFNLTLQETRQYSRKK